MSKSDLNISQSFVSETPPQSRGESPSNKNPNHNLNKSDGPRYERVVVGYRLVPMRADQVDDIARAEGRGQNFNVQDRTPRCSWCWLKTSNKKHGCRWQTEANKGVTPDGGQARQVPIYGWVLKK